MPRGLFVTLPLALPLLALACGAGAMGDDSPEDGGDGGDTGTGTAVRFLEDDPLALQVRQRHEVRLVVERRGAPVAEEAVDLALEGEPHDSSLEALRVRTGADGSAKAVLTGGTVAAAFTLRASLPGGSTARLAVTVSPAGDRITLAILYDGARVVPDYRVEWIPAGDCPALPPPPAEIAALPLILDAEEPALPDPYGWHDLPGAVRVAGLDDGIPLLWGCTRLDAPPDRTEPVPVTLHDLPWPEPGLHDLVIDLDLTAAAAPILEAALLPLAPLETAATPAEFVLDGLRDTLRLRGDPTAAAVLDDRRDSEALDDAVAGVLAGAASTAELAALRPAAAGRLAALRILARLEFGEPRDGGAAALHRWLALVIEPAARTLHADDGTDLLAATRLRFHSDRLEIEPHAVPLGLGRLVDAALADAAGDLAATAPDRLRSRLDAAFPCAAIAGALAASYTLNAVCAAPCLVDTCTAWLDGIAQHLHDTFDAADGAAASLDLSAHCSFLDPLSGRLAPEGRCSGPLEGRWRDTEAAVSGTLSLTPASTPLS